MQIIAHTMEYYGEQISSDLHVSNYSPNDYEEYKRVYEECFFDMRTALGLTPVNCCDNEYELLQKASQIFLLRREGALIGSVAIYENEIDDLIVAKEFQGQGYGRELLLFAVSKMQKDGVKSISLHVADWNQNAVQIYLNNGFVIVKTEIVK
ncbi:GNAT family N-acetyltransferase [Acetatifactor muris]|uniref:Ribosomal-protein-alanine N-acetyltransferase n=1 Tax=Acetatifactor muris TaxID=879566 RepID=A0A2K4ZAY6_9FIRM|nr:GNAT family N-acetyltransferase [Acetatifactor muris]MCR2046283.1 GNAT family N-acetyltransferase [Acetatifactor muris]SOY27611.1 ribosomal-protein-alanine N-acetyltransferase [Acetatifactor muris]